MKLSCPIACALLPLLPWPAMAQVAFAGPDQYLCGDTTHLQGNFVGAGQTGNWSILSGTAVFADPGHPHTQVTALTFGDNELVWTLTDGVTTTTDTVLVVAYDPAAPQAFTMGDTAITAPPYSIALSANPPYPPQSCSWVLVMGAATISHPNDPNATASDLGIGENVLRWACNNGPCGITMWELTIAVNIISTGIPEDGPRDPFSFDPNTGQLSISSMRPIDELRILDVNGRQVHANELSDGLYIATARIGTAIFIRRFVVSR